MASTSASPARMEVDSLTAQEQEIDELEDDYLSDDEDPNTFKIRNPLQPAHAKLLSTRDLHSLIHEGAIDLNPVYQRDVVWPEHKQVGLIDSIFRNFYIPPVVFAVAKDDEGEDVRVCVDGKQRLTSIQKFFDGQIPHKDVVTKKSFWYTTPDSKSSRSEVPERWKQQFAEKLITCVEYSSLPPGAERELFQRVQLGMTLTAAEKLQAISSPWAQWISELEGRHVAVEGGLADVLEWDTKRGRDFQNIAHMVFCCDGLPNQLLPTAQKIEKWMSRVDKPGEQFKDDIEEVLKSFWLIASNKRYSEGFTKISKRIAPVEFIFIGVLLYRLRKSSLEVRGKAIYILRQTIRLEYRDIRNNTDVGKSMWNYIDGLKANPTGWLAVNELTSKNKRRRRHDPDEEDEYRPAPVRSIGKAPKTRGRPAKKS